MRKKSSIFEVSKVSLVVITLGAMLPALNTRAHAAAAPASAPAVAAKVEKVAEIPRLFTPETFCKLVVRAQHEAPAAA